MVTIKTGLTLTSYYHGWHYPLSHKPPPYFLYNTFAIIIFNKKLENVLFIIAQM